MAANKSAVPTRTGKAKNRPPPGRVILRIGTTLASSLPTAGCVSCECAMNPQNRIRANENFNLRNMDFISVTRSLLPPVALSSKRAKRSLDRRIGRGDCFR